jgi:hypothetical protein
VWALFFLQLPHKYHEIADDNAEGKADLATRIRMLRLVEVQWVLFLTMLAANQLAIDVWSYTQGLMLTWWGALVLAQLLFQILLSNNTAHDVSIPLYNLVRGLYLYSIVFAVLGLVGLIREFVSCGELESSSVDRIRECYNAATADNLVSASTFICTDGTGVDAGVSGVCPLVQFGTTGGYFWYIYLAVLCLTELVMAGVAFAGAISVEEFLIQHVFPRPLTAVNDVPVLVKQPPVAPGVRQRAFLAGVQ